ncbi:MAG: aromatic ring-hydroxylating dioxygenase subunit alpha [Pirellulaceae bacterium]|nr:aromatic ring-hydroxylating dioxygenase subunit alpha [Pirellulaceae bacterium]
MDGWLQNLIESRRPGHGLEGTFYTDDTIYQLDIDRVWRRGWLFAGHTCEVANPGDYFTLVVGSESILVLRDDRDQINAFHNVCSHRGTVLCDASKGTVGKIVCAYHQWTYDRAGALIACRGMQEVDHAELSLGKIYCKVVEGMIYVNLSQNPMAFEDAGDLIGSIAKPQALDQAKVAKIVNYQVEANWKIVWENNRECYHCNVNHPQYIKANFDHYNSDDTSPTVKKRIDSISARNQEKWNAAGLAATHHETGMTVFPDIERNQWYSANRTVLVDGYVSETMDGKQVAPLMGEYADADVGTIRIRTMPNFWNHSSCDHSVSTRLLPLGPRQTQVTVYWLVAATAVEGEDYLLEELMPFWQMTSEQDWELCERVQRGVASSGYKPGPFSTTKEYNVDSFVRWYLGQLQIEGAEGVNTGL